jgi:hypothetical protein
MIVRYVGFLMIYRNYICTHNSLSVGPLVLTSNSNILNKEKKCLSLLGKGKCKVPVQMMKADRGSRVLLILNLGARRK